MVRWIYRVEMHLRIRRAVMVEGISIRDASRVFGLHPDTIRRRLQQAAQASGLPD